LGVITMNSAFAHNPLSAMYYLEVEDNLGILNISLSQVGLHEALIKHYPATELDELSDLEYKQLAVEYIKKNFDLKVNGNEVTLSNGGLKLGNHQTDLKFVISNLPKQFNSLDVQINAFKENENHQTVFSLALKGNTDKVILSKKNQYSSSVLFEENKMVADERNSNINYLWFIALVPVLLVGRKILPLGTNER